MTTKKTGPIPSGSPQKSRTLRMDDVRWNFFRGSLGTDWLRAKIDSEIENKSTPAAPTK